MSPMSFPRRILALFLLLRLSAAALFPAEEYAGRLQRAQGMMKTEGIDALFLTMEAHHFYFTGMQSEFWASPTRPYFLVLPAEGQITAVVPTISGTLYEECKHTVGQVLTWPAPRPEDDGVSTLVDVLQGIVPSKQGGRAIIGAELGSELSLRMPGSDFMTLKKRIKSKAQIRDASRLLLKLRVMKSPAEQAIQKQLCKFQSDALDRVPHILKAGMTEKEACRAARIELMKAGADRTPYMACRSGPGGYTDIVGSATDRKLREGDVMIIDAGTMLDGYMCDFNRNWYVGREVPPELMSVQETLYQALEAGIQAAQPGRTTADVYQAMADKLPGAGGDSVGRAGHSVGIAITEWPSILPASAGQNVTLEDGMVFALEPALGFGKLGQYLVHEEMVVVRAGGAVLLSQRGPRSMPLISNGLATPESGSIDSLKKTQKRIGKAVVTSTQAFMWMMVQHDEQCLNEMPRIRVNKTAGITDQISGHGQLFRKH